MLIANCNKTLLPYGCCTQVTNKEKKKQKQIIFVFVKLSAAIFFNQVEHWYDVLPLSACIRLLQQARREQRL